MNKVIHTRDMSQEQLQAFELLRDIWWTILEKTRAFPASLNEIQDEKILSHAWSAICVTAIGMYQDKSLGLSSPDDALPEASERVLDAIVNMWTMKVYQGRSLDEIVVDYVLCRR